MHSWGLAVMMIVVSNVVVNGLEDASTELLHARQLFDQFKLDFRRAYESAAEEL